MPFFSAQYPRGVVASLRIQDEELSGAGEGGTGGRGAAGGVVRLRRAGAGAEGGAAPPWGVEPAPPGAARGAGAGFGRGGSQSGASSPAEACCAKFWELSENTCLLNAGLT